MTGLPAITPGIDPSLRCTTSGCTALCAKWTRNGFASSRSIDLLSMMPWRDGYWPVRSDALLGGQSGTAVELVEAEIVDDHHDDVRALARCRARSGVQCGASRHGSVATGRAASTGALGPTSGHAGA